MKRIYVAGPMTGFPLYNFPAFDQAAAMLRGRGYVVISPAEIARSAGVSEHESVPPSRGDLHRIFRRDVLSIFAVDALYMLAAWQHSKGARIEHDLAIYLDKIVIYQEQLG